MKPQRDKIRIEIHPTSESSETDGVRLQAADQALLALARLIGRQMAREQFQKGMALERKSKRGRNQRKGL